MGPWRVNGFTSQIAKVVALSAIVGLSIASWRVVSAAEIQVPDAVKTAGVLRMGLSNALPPLQFKDPETGEFRGMNVDIGREIAARLGVKAEFNEMLFAQYIPSLQTGRIDIIMGGLSDLPERHSIMEMVDYFRDFYQVYALSNSQLKELSDLCGKRAGAIRSTVWYKVMLAKSESDCVQKGMPAVKLIGTESTPDTRLQLTQGRIDAALQGFVEVPYMIAESKGLYKTIGEPFAPEFKAIGVRKGDVALRDAIADALDAMIKDGTYAKILARYQLSKLAISEVYLNSEPRK
ncbi:MULTISPECIES: ABC transporter substrate-binding protein [Bradyrhizobium]|uniref:ABC transporter substrate-binding protein n=3 Tax=Bradyrhizobium TaxID=374 RepID=A0A410VIV0_9BRAD|nr:MULTISPECIES: ABC transporter substrate-binding protein [Bradyrhizobium]MCG2628029.1 ABC transporter substrate-binding protein [Bradyrhizobium zhengyangense]MCG2643148.1 ABC transporter substrate-binding protein [Bradyrhizobium zhengyangense]MCG2670538.1 ABC transporter substrate-binding protein [Bradyrhizobium zhengyangense]MDN4985727.1 ABC transporter substrate-binding protein [Bradyrhizobium sp. WYCCWR 13022]MDT4736568.1 ABC transporter substrate-binding protein [Bradyrhizobium sp. WYCCW